MSKIYAEANSSKYKGRVMQSSFSRVGLALLLFLSAEHSQAQMVLQADNAALQPQIHRDEIGFVSCGVRGVVLSSTRNFIDAYDFSLMVNGEFFYGTLKAGKSRTSTAAALKGKFSTDAVLPAPIKFWVAQESEGKAINPIKAIPSETKGYILEVADIADTFGGIMAMIHGERMQFAVRYKNEPIDVVVSFSALMPDVERGPLLKCLEGVTERLSKKAS